MARVTPQAAFNAALWHLRTPFAWGLRSDCTAACEAFKALHGLDPLAQCGASYTTAIGAARILNRAGGYLEWCRNTFDMPETDDPRPGDLALIVSADPLGSALSICINRGEYASKSETGMSINRANILGAWSCRF